jgi:predicted component of type VI protein secretion system
MKLSLVVLTPGKQEGKVLDIKLSQFLVGRDPQCHLRPASPMISKRHCAVLQREGKAFVRDFDSTNGTFVNNTPVKGEVELHDGDELKMGPLLFRVRLEAGAPVNRPTPPPPTKATTKTAPAAAMAAANQTPAPATTTPSPEPAGVSADSSTSDEDAAAMLLSLQDDAPSGGPLGGGEVPEGSTVHEMPLPPEVAAQLAKNEKEKPKTPGNTSSAAKSILEKYMRRPRT